MEDIVVSGSFDDIRTREVRFLEEAARLGYVHVYLWSDQAVKRLIGERPKLPERERKYFLEAVRFVHKVWIVDDVPSRDALPKVGDFNPELWVVPAKDDYFQKQQFCALQRIGYQVIHDSALTGFPIAVNENGISITRKKVMVTGCFDWLHSGHVRFFEETSGLGDLYVVVGHDENVRLLKGQEHPMFSQDERRYMVGAIRYVKQALISTGRGWMDAEPEIDEIQPDLYVVNEDGDKPEKRDFCRERGLEYVVLKRTPAAGLPRRDSTRLRGF